MRTNKYPARCAYCGLMVPRNGGKIWKVGHFWRVAHLACTEKKGPQVDVFYIGGKEYIRNKQGRCEDAPCCGCCTI